jgi:mannan endo-1,4-beta-mannosidase
MLSLLTILPAVTLVTAGPAAFPKADGLKFSIDGRSSYFVGTNAYWLPFTEKNADIDLVFGHIKQSGMKVVRTWGFNDVNSIPGNSKLAPPPRPTRS